MISTKLLTKIIQLTTTSGFFLEQDVSTFDAPFFSVTAKEAAGMDPAKRLLLEVAYEAFENGERTAFDHPYAQVLE